MAALTGFSSRWGVPYAPRPLLGTEAFMTATKKQKVDVSKKTVAKKVKVPTAKVAPVKAAPPKKISVIKVNSLKAKPRVRGTSEIELILTKPIGVSTKFCFSNMLSSSQSWRHEGNLREGPQLDTSAGMGLVFLSPPFHPSTLII
jgi:hypothetical protein